MGKVYPIDPAVNTAPRKSPIIGYHQAFVTDRGDIVGLRLNDDVTLALDCLYPDGGGATIRLTIPDLPDLMRMIDAFLHRDGGS